MTYEQFKKAEWLIKTIDETKENIGKLESFFTMKSVTIEGKDENGFTIVYTSGCSDTITEMVELALGTQKRRLQELNERLANI